MERSLPSTDFLHPLANPDAPLKLRAFVRRASCAGLLLSSRRELSSVERAAMKDEIRRRNCRAGWLLLPIPFSSVAGFYLLSLVERLDAILSPPAAMWADIVFGLSAVFLAFLLPAGLLVGAASTLLFSRKLGRDLARDRIELYEGDWRRPSWIEKWLGSSAHALLVRRGLVKPSHQGRVAMEVLSGSRLLWTLNGQRVRLGPALPSDSLGEASQKRHFARFTVSRSLDASERRELARGSRRWDEVLPLLRSCFKFACIGGALYFYRAWLPALPITGAWLNVVFKAAGVFFLWRCLDPLLALWPIFQRWRRLWNDCGAGVVGVLRTSNQNELHAMLTELKHINGEPTLLAARVLDETIARMQAKDFDLNANDSNLPAREHVIEFLPESGVLWSFNGLPADWR